MRSDIILGLVTLALAILGGVVSAHAPAKVYQKWLYVAMFVVLGVVGMSFVIKQSNETTEASVRLARSISDLSDSSKESTRLTAENSQLQERLLGLADKILQTTNENLSQVTGGTTYPKVISIKEKEGWRLAVIAQGKYDLTNVSITVLQHAQLASSAQDLMSFIRTNSLREIVPRVYQGHAMELGISPIVPQGDNETLRIDMSANNGSWLETLTAKRIGGAWTEQRVVRDSKGKILEEDPTTEHR
jgi:hypothetical protein